MSQRFVVVYEAPADFATATELADRVLVAAIGWLDETLLESQRQWVGEDQRGSRLEWKSIPRRARELGIRAHGHFDDGPAMPDAQAARRAMAYILRRFDKVDAILLIRDMDDQAVRKRGLEQARTVFAPLIRIAIGVAVVERESWIICGFDPTSADEQEKLAEEAKKLGFNPCLRSHELTACKNDQATRSPKRVLAALTDNTWDRQRKCWGETALAVLEERGHANGLKDYFEEVKQNLVPLIAG